MSEAGHELALGRTASPDGRQVRRLARDTFGFERLRPGQEEAIRAVANGGDTLAVLPRGGGSRRSTSSSPCSSPARRSYRP